MKKLLLPFLLLTAIPAWADKIPLQMGMAFKCGDAKSPVLRGVATQVTVKNRCADGSVKFAIFNAVLDGKPGDKPRLDFIEGKPVTGLMAVPALDLEMEVKTYIGSVVTPYQWQAQKLPMTTWFSGPIATSVRYADYKSTGQFRPIFEVTHWHGINKTFVRFIGENANTEAVAELWQEITLKINGEIVYQKPAGPFPRASRWTKTLWINGPPVPSTPKYSLDYLKSTGVVPNYITSLTPPASQLDQVYKEWLAAPKDLADSGNLQKAMGAAGARPELGPLPTWTVLFLYTGDKRILEVARGNADLGASFPVHYREGNPAKSFYGRPLSILDRPTIHLLNIQYPSTTEDDRIKLVGDPDSWGWNPDAAHIPDLYSALYVITGEEWYEEQLRFWASYVTAYPNGAAINNNCGRGPTGKEGGFPGIRCMSMRAWAWSLRLKALAAVLTPDDQPLEKSYYAQVTKDQLVQAEGERNINPRSDSYWQWARSIFHADDNNPNHNWDNGNSSFAQDPIDSSKVSAGYSMFERSFVQHNLYRVEELGFPSRPLIDWQRFSIDGLVKVDYRLGGMYRMPSLKLDGTPIAFSEIPQYYIQPLDLAKVADDQTRGDHGYLWAFMNAGGPDLRTDSDAPSNVKWMIVPRLR